MKEFFLILIILLQLADSLEKQYAAHHHHRHALYGLGTITVLSLLDVQLSMREPKCMPYHELGVSFGQSVGHKSNGL